MSLTISGVFSDITTSWLLGTGVTTTYLNVLEGRSRATQSLPRLSMILGLLHRTVDIKRFVLRRTIVTCS